MKKLDLLLIATACVFLVFTCGAFAAERPVTKPGFEKQILDVTYGEIWRPSGWHFRP
jgi:hypothetical protein